MVKKRRKEATPELNMKPAMNLILILIPLLLTSMEAVKIAVINVATPQIGPASVAQKPQDTPDEKPLKLTLALTDRGITVFAKDQVIENKDDPLGPTIPKIDGEEEDANGKMVEARVYDYDKLKEILVDIKSQHQAEENVIISAEPNIKYEYIIHIMDISRESKEGKKKKTMFPNVVLSAGVA
ncbi:biopolymer transporter ExbD [bacterium]|nr:biopolymer transporter ExbD [bacterium]